MGDVGGASSAKGEMVREEEEIGGEMRGEVGNGGMTEEGVLEREDEALLADCDSLTGRGCDMYQQDMDDRSSKPKWQSLAAHVGIPPRGWRSSAPCQSHPPRLTC